MTNKCAEKLYHSRAWRTCRNAYLKSVGGLCERCRAQGIIRAAEHVHHKIRLTAENVGNPNVSLNWDNLEALCAEHHAAEHSGVKRYIVGENGEIITKKERGF